MAERTIYALYDDREPGGWRYVGQTWKPAERLQFHRSNRTAGIPADHLAMATLEVVEAEKALEAERQWIVRCALEGYDLANKIGHPRNQAMIRMGCMIAKWDRDMLVEMARANGVSNSDMLRRLILLAYTKREDKAEAEQERVNA